jgi:NAD(P)-dependent dehydrogenase (short-subunit alcohol dehydrogenase family)
MITGCASGIGLATAVAFATCGDVVVATVRDLNRTDSLRAALDAIGDTASIAQLDVTDDDSVSSAVDATLAAHGRIDVLVSNAGVLYEGSSEELDIEAFRHSFDVNVLGAVRLIKAVLPAMRVAGNGHIIAVSSMAGIFGQPFNDAYCSSKFGLEGLFESLFPVAGSVGVHVSMIEPGPVDDDFVNRGTEPSVDGNGPYGAARANFARLKQGAYIGAPKPADIAAQILTIADDPAPKLRYQTSESVTKMAALKLKDLSGERVTSMTSAWLR